VRAPTAWQWRLLLAAALAIVVLWPPAEGRSLAVAFVNWAVDPTGRLPVLPPQLPLGSGDDPDKVEARDALVREYDAALARGGWTRTRLALKVAREPLEPTLMRQLLTVAGVVLAATVWRVASGRSA
jgi:hypothetical protein